MKTAYRNLIAGAGCRMALASVLFTATGITAVRAAELGDLRLSGYGTLGYTIDDRKQIAPLRDISQRPNTHLSGSPTWRLDSRLGLQAEYRLNSEFEMVGQAVWRDRVDGTLGNSIELAYAAWRPIPKLDLRLGRIGYDAFLMSDTRNLGYAYSWVRPPTEFYGWTPVFSVDGADAAYTLDDGDARWRFKAQAGRSGTPIPMGDKAYDFRSSDLWNLSLTRQTGPLRLKAAYSRYVISSEASPLNELRNGLTQITSAANTAGFTQIGNEADDIRRNLSFQNTRVHFVTLGIAYDDGTWMAQAEYSNSKASSAIVPQGQAAYASLGRRFGNWTPYAMLSISRPERGLRTASSDWSVIGQASNQQQALYVLNTTRIDQRSLALGMRWDFHEQAALKLQWDHTRIDPSGYGMWYRALPLNNVSSHINLLSMTLDFVF